MIGFCQFGASVEAIWAVLPGALSAQTPIGRSPIRLVVHLTVDSLRPGDLPRLDRDRPPTIAALIGVVPTEPLDGRTLAEVVDDPR